MVFGFLATVTPLRQSTVYVRAIFTRSGRMEVTRTKFFVVNGISILSLWNIQLTFQQEGVRRNERHH